MIGQPSLDDLVKAILADDSGALVAMLAAAPELATARSAGEAFLWPIGHYLYRGDTALHVAAAGYREATVRELVAHGAEVGASNRRGAQPLHYAADGQPGSVTWDPAAQRATVIALIQAGADPNAPDKGGATPLHRAVRTRCAAAVAALLAGGADPVAANEHASTPRDLATKTTGRGGSGSPAARAQQAEILGLLGLPGGAGTGR